MVYTPAGGLGAKTTPAVVPLVVEIAALAGLTATTTEVAPGMFCVSEKALLVENVRVTALPQPKPVGVGEIGEIGTMH